MCGAASILPLQHILKDLRPCGAKTIQDLPIKFLGEIFLTDIVPAFIMENVRRMDKPMIWAFRAGGVKGLVFYARQESTLDGVLKSF